VVFFFTKNKQIKKFQQILLVGFATKILGFFSSVNSTNFVHFWKDSPNFQYHKFEKKTKKQKNPSMLIVGSLTSEYFASKLIYFGVDVSVFQVARIGIT
jgi:hypothetical protein